MTIGKFIREYRLKNKIKKEKMAIDLGISVAYLNSLEYNHRTSVSQEVLIKIARYLKISADELLGLKPPKK